MLVRTVVPNKITRPEAIAIVSRSVGRLCLNHGKDRVALEAGCDEKTIRKARDGVSLPTIDTLGNLLTLDASALDELLAHFGLKAVPLEAADESDARLLAGTMRLCAAMSDAMADGRIDHIEEQRLAKLARPVATEWNGRVAQADRKVA